MRTYIKKWKMQVIVLGIIFVFIILFYLDIFNVLSKYGISIQSWAPIFGSIIAVLGTWAVTKYQTKIQIDKQEEIYKSEKELQKEFAYKSMNRQNIDFIYNEIYVFLDRLMYAHKLYSLEIFLRTSIFDSEYEIIDKLNIRFIKDLKDSYYYDNEIVELCEFSIDQLENYKLEYDSYCDCKARDHYIGILNKFEKIFSIREKNNENKLYDNSFNKAILKLYEFSSKKSNDLSFKLKLNILFDTNYANDTLINEFFDFITQVKLKAIEFCDLNREKSSANKYIVNAVMVVILKKIFEATNSDKDIIQVKMDYHKIFGYVPSYAEIRPVDINIEQLRCNYKYFNEFNEYVICNKAFNYGVNDDTLKIKFVNTFRERLSSISEYYSHTIESNKRLI